MRNNLLVVRAGDESLHRSWISGRGERNFDLLVSYYGQVSGHYKGDAEHYHAMVGPRWPGHHDLCTQFAEAIAQYDYVGFACDDLKAGLSTWNQLFDTCRRHYLDLAQPSVKGYRSYDITRPRRGCVLRFTNFVEVMCPVFSRRALALVRPTFAESISGWGLTVAWLSRLSSDHRIAILDRVRVRHSRPIGQGGLYEVVKGLGVDANQELKRLKQQYGREDYQPVERGRLMMPLHSHLARLAPRLYR